MRRVSVWIIATAAFLASAASAAAVVDFVTPRKAAYCGVSHGEPLRLICWRPSDGLTFDMTRRGRVQRRLYAPNRGYYDPAPGRVLRFGQMWRLPAYWTCVSWLTGVTCTNSSGHGWWLGRLRGSRAY
jgi:hypothetical protein